MSKITVPYSPNQISEHLSNFKSWRENQKEVVDKIINSDKKYIIVNAPTGVGKSLIAVSSALLNNGKTHIITYSKQLQDQYSEFKDIKTIKGRVNYPCVQMSGLTADNCLMTVGQKCQYVNNCPYNKAKEEALNAKIVCLNNAYYLNISNYTDAFSNCDMLIVDEAHILEHSLMSFVETTLAKSKMDALQLPYPKPRENIFEYLKDLLAKTSLKISTLEEEINYMKEINDKEGCIELSKLLNQYKSYHSKAEFLLINLDNTWVIDYTPTITSFKPIFIKEYTNKLIFSHADKIVLMSATINKSIIDILNIPKDNYEYIEIPSPFPVENRPLIFMPKVNMGYKTQQKALPVLLSLINQILDKHEYEKGIIHTVSNSLAYYINEHCSHKDRILIASGSNKENILDKFKNTKNGVLVSPSLDTGADFKYGEGRFQIIIKLPFPSLADKQIKKRAEIDKEWYINQMANKLVQMYGRTNRAEDDYSITYLVDERFNYYLNKYQYHFPKWFIEAIKVVR